MPKNGSSPYPESATSYHIYIIHDALLTSARTHKRLILGDKPVSYTHLDVYKRQLVMQVGQRVAANHGLGQRFGLNQVKPVVVGPVSYTHLDVYKRQGPF